MSRKRGIRQLVEYIFKEDASDGKAQMKLKHNLSGHDVQGWIKQMEFNESLRQRKYSNSISVYHEVISFHQGDREKLTGKILLDLGKKYIELRGEKNMYIMREHRDKDHIHVHIAMSASEFLTGKSSRISMADFSKFKREMEKYQLKMYPQLTHSLVQKSRGSLEQNLKDKRAEGKGKIETVFRNLLKNNQSKENVMKELREKGYEPYFRNGKLVGIKDDKDMKFRFSAFEQDYTVLFGGTSKEEEMNEKMDNLDSLRQVADIERDRESIYIKEEQTEDTMDESEITEDTNEENR